MLASMRQVQALGSTEGAGVDVVGAGGGLGEVEGARWTATACASHLPNAHAAGERRCVAVHTTTTSASQGILLRVH